jgi:O-acetyl-ADP-ribose deacetylase (regulator of RNase III)
VRRAILNKYVDLLGQADVLHSLRESPGRYVLFLGAGVSKEAQVPLADEICEDIKTRLLTGRGDIVDTDAWAQETLAWKDPSRRYMTCLNAYGSAEERLTYFRQLLKDTRPAFAHYALALLMTRGRFFETAFTTNFDKLLERAFLEQGARECQAIRTEGEVEYWVAESGKCYLFKLHGDYDTHNILNTQPETRSVPKFFLSHALNSLRGRGLLVMGSAANEESIVEFVKQLSGSDDRPVLSRGIRWGVFVGSRRPENLSATDELTYLEKAIERGAVSRQVVELLGDMHDKFGDRRPCSLFPVWGSGNFLLSLINTSGDSEVAQTAQLFLDHNMRLHATFRKQQMDPKVIETHIEKLEHALRKIGLDMQAPDRPARHAFHASAKDAATLVRIAYGDVTTAATMNNGDFSECRRAIVSPEDTTISAGGGVALRLLTRAGPRQLLNELAKLSPIAQGTCAATSAGNLPVHYILHAAALRILPDGSYDINPDHIEKTIGNVLHVGEALQVGATWIPLLGAGVADIPPADSLAAIVKAIFSVETRLPKRVITIVIFQESILSRDAVRAVLRSTLPTDYSVTED